MDQVIKNKFKSIKKQLNRHDGRLQKLEPAPEPECSCWEMKLGYCSKHNIPHPYQTAMEENIKEVLSKKEPKCSCGNRNRRQEDAHYSDCPVHPDPAPEPEQGCVNIIGHRKKCGKPTMNGSNYCPGCWRWLGNLDNDDPALPLRAQVAKIVGLEVPDKLTIGWAMDALEEYSEIYRWAIDCHLQGDCYEIRIADKKYFHQGSLSEAICLAIVKHKERK